MPKQATKKVATPAAKSAARRPDPIRMVKLWLPASLIRSVDETVTVSEGAYRDRDEFFAEAARDRLREESERRAGVTQQADTETAVATVGLPVLGVWRSAKVATAPALPATAHGGLHNRDVPTIWSAHQLLEITTERGEAVSYRDFIAAITPRASELGAILAQRDKYREQGALKASIGFPAPDEPTSAERFRIHMVGEIVLGGTSETPRLRGPLFAFGLATVRDGYLLPTPAGEAVLRQLLDDGWTLVPPQPEAAWLTFRAHLAEVLREDLIALQTVLQVCAKSPTRTELTAALTATWKDATGIQLTGLVSRLREWGLLSSRLENGRYSITTAGEHELQRPMAEVAA